MPIQTNPADKRIEFAAVRAARVGALREWLVACLNKKSGITLEIGCGHGHFLVAYAEAHPNEFCVGVDLLAKRIERATRKRNRMALGNLDFIKADAFEFLEAFPNHGRLGHVFFLFSDPWPKKRHHKNRLIQTTLLDRLAVLSQPGRTRLHFRTDHREYFSWTRTLLEGHPQWQLLGDAVWPFEHETLFSQRLPDYQSLVACSKSRL